MAQSEIVKKYKTLGKASMWCAIGSLLIFFLNIIALIALLAVAISQGDSGWDAFEIQLYYLSLITEIIALCCVLTWMVMAIIEIKMVNKSAELKKYHPGGFTAWILGMIIALSFIFLSLLMFGLFATKTKNIVYVTFVLFLFSCVGSILYIAGIAKDVRKINNNAVAKPVKK